MTRVQRARADAPPRPPARARLMRTPTGFDYITRKRRAWREGIRGSRLRRLLATSTSAWQAGFGGRESGVGTGESEAGSQKREPRMNTQGRDRSRPCRVQRVHASPPLAVPAEHAVQFREPRAGLSGIFSLCESRSCFLPLLSQSRPRHNASRHRPFHPARRPRRHAPNGSHLAPDRDGR